MQTGKWNAVIDLQFGSTAKGSISYYLATKYGNAIDMYASGNMSNAGHTAIDASGEQFIGIQLPACTLHKKLNGGEQAVILTGGCGITIDRLMYEIDQMGLTETDLFINPNALIITEEHAKIEAKGGSKADGTIGDKDKASAAVKIGSTQKGCGAAMIERIIRNPDSKILAGKCGDRRLEPYLADTRDMMQHMLSTGGTILHEGSQGAGLDLLHGFWPYVTSRMVNTMQFMAESGIPPRAVGDVYGVMRTFPIRVANRYKKHGDPTSEMIGTSGPTFPDSVELDWQDVSNNCGAPHNLCEYTTVTKLPRRIFSFSGMMARNYAEMNGATKIALTFMNYIDWSCYGLGGGASAFEKLSSKCKNFIDQVEQATGVPVTLINTGPNNDHIIDRELND